MAVSIPLGSRTQSKVAIVDEEDSDLKELRWNQAGRPYAKRNVGGRGFQRPLYMHRVVLERKLGRPLVKGEVVDHINGEGLDNRRANLRLATPSQNIQNQRRNKNNTSGFKGVAFNKTGKKWQVRLKVGLCNTHVGLFDNVIDAAVAYDRAAYLAYGDFALCNFPRFACGL